MNEERGRDERGRPATIDRSTGEVHGSGSAAGGGGNAREDYDSDPMGGAGAEPAGGPVAAEDAERRPADRHQGHEG